MQRLQAEMQREQDRSAQLVEHHATLRHQLDLLHRCCPAASSLRRIMHAARPWSAANDAGCSAA